MAIAAAMQQWNLHRRIALAVMRAIGVAPARLLLGSLAATAFVSLWISNTATAAMMFPIGLAVIAQLEAQAGGRRLAHYGMAIMLSIAYGSNVGGIGTKIGTAPNALFSGFLERMGQDITFFQFMAVGLPFVLMFLPVVWLALWRIGRRDELGDVAGGEAVEREWVKLGPVAPQERWVLGVFLLTAVLWMAGKPLTDLVRERFPTASAGHVEGGIAVAAALVLMALRPRGAALLHPRSLRRVPWSALVLLGGGFALAAGVQGSGLSRAMAERLARPGVAAALLAAPPGEPGHGRHLGRRVEHRHHHHHARRAARRRVAGDRDAGALRGHHRLLLRLRPARRHAAQRHRLRQRLRHHPAHGPHRRHPRPPGGAPRRGLVLGGGAVGSLAPRSRVRNARSKSLERLRGAPANILPCRHLRRAPWRRGRACALHRRVTIDLAHEELTTQRVPVDAPSRRSGRVSMSNPKTPRLIGAALALLLLCPIAAQAQLQTGDLYGIVRDEQGQPLPGVNLTLTGVGGPKTTQTDASGRFRFLALFPGEYTLTAELDGYSTVEQTAIGVRLGGKLEIELTMSSAIQETITVTSEATLINPREQNQGPVLSAQELDKIPTARDPWSLLRQAPGVITDRINVGGNESGQQSDFYAGGATTSDNTFAVDGVILTDMAAVGASATYYDFGAYEEVQLTTASTDVTIQTAGVTVNQVTKRGTNTWKGDGRFLRTEGDWQADTTEVNGNKIDQVEEYGANLGGPLMRDHLWIWASYGESDIGNLAQGGQLDRTQLEDFNSKLNFQTTNNSGVAHFWTNDKIKTGRNAGPLFAPESTWNQTTPSDIWKLEDTHVFGSNFYLTGLYSVDDGAFTLAPQGGLDADVLLDEDGVWQNSYWDFRQHGEIEQYKLEGNSFFDTGGWGHELKFGAGYREQVNDSISVLPGSGRAVLTCEGYGCEPTDEDGNFLDNVELVEWSRHDVAVTTEYDSAWIQDTLTHDRFTITAGLRYDKQTGHNRAHSDPGNPDVPSGLLPGDQLRR